MAALSLLGSIAAIAFATALLLPTARYQWVVAGLVTAALGAGSLRTGLGAGQFGSVGQLIRSPGQAGWFFWVGLGLMLLGAVVAVVGALRDARSTNSFESTPVVVRPTVVQSAELLLGFAAVLSPHVPTTISLVFLAGALELLTTGRITRQILLAVVLVALASAATLMATIIGPVPASYTGLRDGPIGDPAARMLVLLLLAPIMVYLTSWPLIPAGVAMLGRVAAELLPAGVQLWQGIAMPVALLVAGWGVVQQLPLLSGAALGMFGLWAGNFTGRIGGGLLLAGCVIWPLRSAAHRTLATGIHRAAAGLMGAGLVLTIGGGLEAQVVYSVLLAVSVAAVLIVPLNARRGVASP